MARDAYGHSQTGPGSYRADREIRERERAERENRHGDHYSVTASSAYNGSVGHHSKSQRSHYRERGVAGSPGIEGLEHEGEEDIEDEQEEQDQTPYCICQRPSFGEMVGCDGEGCPYEWASVSSSVLSRIFMLQLQYHLACTDLKVAPPADEDWICPHCLEKMRTKRRKSNGNGLSNANARSSADKKSGSASRADDGRRAVNSRKR